MTLYDRLCITQYYITSTNLHSEGTYNVNCILNNPILHLFVQQECDNWAKGDFLCLPYLNRFWKEEENGEGDNQINIVSICNISLYQGLRGEKPQGQVTISHMFLKRPSMYWISGGHILQRKYTDDSVHAHHILRMRHRSFP